MTETMTAQFTLPTAFSDALSQQITATVNTAVNTAVSNALNNADATSPYLTLSAARGYAMVSRNTLAKWLSQGLKRVKIDGVTRIKRNDLESFMDSHTEED